MADSGITKQALASSLKTLMKETSFDKITVSMICHGCNMNRKSFYYHFKDKYDLVNWIFDSEFINTLDPDISDQRWEVLKLLLAYFDENYNFYSKAFAIKGQNSFSEHFRGYVYPVMVQRLTVLAGEKATYQFCVEFLCDAFCCAIERWLLAKEHMKWQEFFDLLQTMIHNMATIIYNEMTQKYTE